jgi:hypothetical protein
MSPSANPLVSGLAGSIQCEERLALTMNRP